MNKLFLNVCLVFVLLPLPFFAQDKFKLDTDKFSVAINSPKTKEKMVIATAVTPETFTEGTSIKWSGYEGFLDVKQSLSSDRKTITSTFTAKKIVQSQNVAATIDGESHSIEVTVHPEVSTNTVTIALSNDEKSNGISITKGGTKPYRLKLNSGGEIPSNAITVKSENDAIATAILQGEVLTIRAVNDGPTNIKILGYGDPIGNLSVTTTPGIDISAIPSRITVLRSESNPIELKDSLKMDLNRLIISPTINQEIAKISAQNQLIGLKAGETTFKVAVKDVPDRYKDITVEVKAKAEKIVTNFPLNNKSLIKGQPFSFNASVEGEGETISNATIDISSSDSTCVSVSKTTGNNFIIRAEKDACNAVTLTATAAANGQTVTQTFVLLPSSVTGFAPLRIRLDILDRQTARDLFGRKADDEYFITKVRLFNDIRIDDVSVGKSILVYSESLEVKVGVEWREVGGSGAHKEWRTLDEKTALTWFKNANLTSNSAYKTCRTITQPHLFIPYRPLTYDMVTNTHERRDNRSGRSRFFLALYGFSTLASAVTSVAVPGAGSDIPLGLDKFRNLLIPGLEKLFPSLKEVQRQNITSMVMKPLEEVPFGSDLTKILFFPKRTIVGVLINDPLGTARRTELRISAISSSDACAPVGIIDKIQSTP